MDSIDTIKRNGRDVARDAMNTDAQRCVDTIKAKMETRPQIDCPLKHHFTPGLYFRELFVPKDTLFVTKIHQTEHPFIIASGEFLVWTEADGVKLVKAPHMGITTPGTRRVGRALTNLTWFTFHATDKTDLAELEEFLFYDPEKDSFDAEIIEHLKAA